MIRLILAFLAAIFSLIAVIHLAANALDSVTQQGAQAQAFVAAQMIKR